MTLAWYDFVGFAGTLAILVAFFLLQAGKMDGNGRAYQLVNMFGAAGILVTLLGGFNAAVFVLESAWVLVSAYGLWRGRGKSPGV